MFSWITCSVLNQDRRRQTRWVGRALIRLSGMRLSFHKKTQGWMGDKQMIMLTAVTTTSFRLWWTLQIFLALVLTWAFMLVVVLVFSLNLCVVRIPGSQVLFVTRSKSPVNFSGLARRLRSMFRQRKLRQLRKPSRPGVAWQCLGRVFPKSFWIEKLHGKHRNILRDNFFPSLNWTSSEAPTTRRGVPGITLGSFQWALLGCKYRFSVPFHRAARSTRLTLPKKCTQKTEVYTHHDLEMKGSTRVADIAYRPLAQRVDMLGDLAGPMGIFSVDSRKFSQFLVIFLPTSVGRWTVLFRLSWYSSETRTFQSDAPRICWGAWFLNITILIIVPWRHIDPGQPFPNWRWVKIGWNSSWVHLMKSVFLQRFATLRYWMPFGCWWMWSGTMWT